MLNRLVLTCSELIASCCTAGAASAASAAYEGVAKGECAVAVTMEYAAYEYVAGGLKEIKLVYPAEGTFLSPEGMALIKGGKNPAEARKLDEFLASKATQTEVFKSAFRRPLRTDIDVSQLDDAAMGADRAAFLAQWRQLLAARCSLTAAPDHERVL